MCSQVSNQAMWSEGKVVLAERLAGLFKPKLFLPVICSSNVSLVSTSFTKKKKTRSSMTFKSERKVVLREKEVRHSLTLEAGFGAHLSLP